MMTFLFCNIFLLATCLILLFHLVIKIDDTGYHRSLHEERSKEYAAKIKAYEDALLSLDLKKQSDTRTTPKNPLDMTTLC